MNSSRAEASLMKRGASRVWSRRLRWSERHADTVHARRRSALNGELHSSGSSPSLVARAGR